MAGELWTIDQVADLLGVKPDSARGTLSRWKIRAAERRVDERGRAHALFQASEVKAAHAERPGRGRRTDLEK